MNIIQKIYEDNFDFVASLEKHTGVKELVQNIYPDEAHFIYELLQNAEDAGASEVEFVLSDKQLMFIHKTDYRVNIDSICIE